MAKFSPQEKLYKLINSLSTAAGIVFYLILSLSIAPIVFNEFCKRNNITQFIDLLNIIGIGLFFVLDMVKDYILIPFAEKKRRDDFIDNSLGSAFLPMGSIDYFDNEEVAKGLYKASVNLFQNCFFTFSLVKAITLQKIIIPTVGLLFMIVFSYYGLKDAPYALPILQALFSARLLGGLIKHLILLDRLDNLNDSWITLFQHSDIKANISQYHAAIYRYWLQYESLLSRINPEIPSKTYTRLNDPLTDEWNKIKLKYNIN